MKRSIIQPILAKKGKDLAYYTERHGLRKPVDLTEKINPDMYRLLIETCFKYNDNIAWKYPSECPDGYGCSGLDRERFCRIKI